MKDPKIEALIQFLGFDEADYGRFTQSDHNSNIYIIDDGKEIKSCYQNNEFLVCTEDEADVEYHEAFMSLVEEMGLTSFTETAQEYIMDHFVNADKDNWFDLAYEESTRSYAEDIILETEKGEMFTVAGPDEDVNVTITNRLLLECIENHIIYPSDLEVGINITEEGEWTGGDLVEKYCDYFDSATKAGYEDAVDWYRSDFGDEAFRDALMHHDIIDWDRVEEWTKEEDGRGNELNRWDGNEYDTKVDGTTYYIYPDCDFEELESVKAEKEDIDR